MPQFKVHDKQKQYFNINVAKLCTELLSFADCL